MVGEEFFEDGIVLLDKEIVVSIAALDGTGRGVLSAASAEKRIRVAFFNDLFNRGKIDNAISLSESL